METGAAQPEAEHSAESEHAAQPEAEHSAQPESEHSTQPEAENSGEFEHVNNKKRKPNFKPRGPNKCKLFGKSKKWREVRTHLFS